MVELKKTKKRSGVLYNIHLKYCEDKWLKPVKRYTFQNRITRWGNEKTAVFTPNQWKWGNRRWEDCIKNKWRAEVKAWTYTDYYQKYLYNYNKTHGRTYNCG